MSVLAVNGATSGNRFLDRAIGDSEQLPTDLGTKVRLRKGQTLDTETYVYFPIDALVALNFVLHNAHVTEIRQIGSEGFVGMSAFGDQHAFEGAAVVVSAGSAYRMRATVVREIFDQSQHFRMTSLQYMQLLMRVASQKLICTRFHSIAEQLSLNLLVSADRLGNQTIRLTHEQLATTIGCRREAVSLAARQMQLGGLIDYGYGKITILDKKAIETHACECYSTVRQAFSAFYMPDKRDMADQVDG